MSGMGEVEITLAGVKQQLRCSLRAARTVSALSGGFSAAYQGLSGYNLSIYTAIVAAGLDKRGNDAAAVEKQVYETGLEGLAAPLSRYLGLLMNGGREAAPIVDGEDAENPNG